VKPVLKHSGTSNPVEELPMKRMVFNFLLLFAASACLLSACYSRRQQPANTGTGIVAAPTVSPATNNPTPNQPAPQPTATGTASAATKTGWWIRINPNLTTAQMITFQIGTGKLQREEWRVWRAGEPVEFDVPANYLQAPRLYLRGNVTPIGKNADLCMMYKNRGVEHMDFTDDESETKSQTQVDFKCR
jgi:hypothetical protein